MGEDWHPTISATWALITVGMEPIDQPTSDVVHDGHTEVGSAVGTGLTPIARWVTPSPTSGGGISAI